MSYKSGGQEVQEGDVLNMAGDTILSATAGTQIVAEATANATDLPTSQALANALKVKVNAILAMLQAKKFPIA